MICLYIKVLKDSMCVIFEDSYWVVQTPFVRMVKSKFLAYLPVDHLVDLICCIRLLCDWWFHLCDCITYIYYYVASYLFSLWYDWFFLLLFHYFLTSVLMCFFFTEVWVAASLLRFLGSLWALWWSHCYSMDGLNSSFGFQSDMESKNDWSCGNSLQE